DRPKFGARRRVPLQLGLLAVSAILAFAENPEMALDRMTDDELRAFRDHKIVELRAHSRETRPESTPEGTVYPHIFFCTIYYTPMESGFTVERGFDVTPISAAGLRGRKYPRDFLLAVKKEGFGRVSESVEGRNYIRWMGGASYAFANTPVGRRGELLVPR